MRPDVRVIKIGGSLWDWPELASSFTAWFQPSSLGFDLLVVGGGSTVDSVRDKQATWQLKDDAAHWMALRVMSCHAQAAATLFNLPPPLESMDAIETAIQCDDAEARLAQRQIHVVSIERILRENVQAVESTWDITSDSLAAWLAQRIQATELIVLKSGSPPEERANVGYFDPEFARYLEGIPLVRVVNLRLPGWPSWDAHVRGDGTVVCAPVAIHESGVRLMGGG